MKYDEIASQTDYRAACGLYISEVYGDAVVHQLPGVLDTLWDCVLFRMPEEMAHIAIFTDHRLPPPKQGD
ncbi:hypothetical protein [Pseudomonas sp. Pdm06]|uniref:hypothetical protein n=1 Tax=Pseudomonas sp. Pdm06 TaxID=1790044 RepID=UPI001786BD6D|nr:hypothetical protein [Pseudomonas sp. Pdm06]MBD9461630.1 hypothetical protein [Pseudomonas sp. Pdm06]